MIKIYTPNPEVKYRPLPDCLTIKKSNIEGLGLFATKRIEALVNLGMTHIKNGGNIVVKGYDKNEYTLEDKKFENGYIRTPLGGFINHSNTPNCIKGEDIRYHKGFSKYLYLWTNRVIEEGEELTLNYTLYKMK